MYRDRDHDRHQHTLFWLAVTVISFTVFIMCVKNLWNRYLRYKENRRAKSWSACSPQPHRIQRHRNEMLATFAGAAWSGFGYHTYCNESGSRFP